MPDDGIIKDGQVKVDRNNIKVGMYVSELDRPWEGSGYLFQGFYLANIKQVEDLKNKCAYVICLKSRSQRGIFGETEPKPAEITMPLASVSVKRVQQATSAAQSKKSNSPSKKPKFSFIQAPAVALGWTKDVLNELFPPKAKDSASFHKSEGDDKLEAAVRLVRRKDSIRIFKQFDGEKNREVALYSNQSDIQSEVKAASKMKGVLLDALPNLVEEMSSSAMASQIVFSKEALSNVVESMIRNPDAMQLVSRLNSAEEGAIQRAMDFSLLMISFGREIGLTKDELVDVGIGGLLHDIGVTKVLGGAFSKKKIQTPAEMKIYKQHVVLGIQALDEMKITNQVIRDIVGNHHERADGQGFPNGLKGNEIGLYGSMAVICDGYVGMVSGHNRKAPTTPSYAISNMLKQSGDVYHPALMQQFIQVVGIYPVGSVVMLSSNEVGIVISQNRLSRLRPVVRLILNPKGRRYKEQPHMDLKHRSVSDIVITKEIPQGHPQILDKDYLLE